MNITILTDNPKSWIIPFALELSKKISTHQVKHVYRHQDIEEGDVLVILSCEKILTKATMCLNRYNVVVHPSDLPQGRGWSPLAWQVLEGKSIIPITLFEAAEDVDAGDIYIRDVIQLEGHELNEEIKQLQGVKTVEMVLQFLKMLPDPARTPQVGSPTFYARRKAVDSELDVGKTIVEQFNLLRVVDNERYPAFFWHKGYKYILRIERAPDRD